MFGMFDNPLLDEFCCEDDFQHLLEKDVDEFTDMFCNYDGSKDTESTED